MEDGVLEKLGRIAYEAHANLSDKDTENYFKSDATSWGQLPLRVKRHWKKIAKAVAENSWYYDLGDTVE